MKKLAFAIAAVAAAALSGCLAPPQTSVAGGPPVDTRVTVAPNLFGDVVVTDVRCAKGTGGYLTLQANLVNNCSRPLAVDWRVQWLDADGVEIDSAVCTWNSRMLQPYEICGLKGTASRVDAADMRIYVRESKK